MESRKLLFGYYLGVKHVCGLAGKVYVRCDLYNCLSGELTLVHPWCCCFFLFSSFLVLTGNATQEKLSSSCGVSLHRCAEAEKMQKVYEAGILTLFFFYASMDLNNCIDHR